MVRKYMDSALIYAVLAMVCGVFYREFTKIMVFSAKTTLSVLHTHYFLLGVFFFLILVVMEKLFAFSSQRSVKITCLFYHVGLNITALGLFLRGIVQVMYTSGVSRALDASISGISGIGHIIMCIAMLFLFTRIRRKMVRTS